MHQLRSIRHMQLLGSVRFNRVRDVVDNLDFSLAAQLLRESRCPIPA
jgi:hypothetical protein